MHCVGNTTEIPGFGRPRLNRRALAHTGGRGMRAAAAALQSGIALFTEPRGRDASPGPRSVSGSRTASGEVSRVPDARGAFGSGGAAVLEPDARPIGSRSDRAAEP
ncbi:hypothetical protein ME121_4645 [Methylobacterium sp. ME121]|nr:hypothetical protein ME121_4645 [Methylobacterium sp. ME121]GEN00950.1 hypothetical protein MRA01_54890 [Methylobacterium radiotolerans]